MRGWHTWPCRGWQAVELVVLMTCIGVALAGGVM